MEPSTKSKAKPKNNKKLIVSLIIVAILAALVTVLVVQRLEINRLNNPAAVAEQAKADATKLKDKVSKLMQLPDEEATIATVQDSDKLKEQEFFKNAKNGDKVLIFTTDKKAVIYRESENKVINSGPIVLNSNTDNNPETKQD
jgi:lipopolysaccharide export LptBFGC system permease protein LptF